MKITSEVDMVKYGQEFAQKLKLPAVIELVGDVGTGKTTFTRGLAAGLGVAEPVTSPSFNISKRYGFRLPGGNEGELIHYDFYRLNDPGIMSSELAEALSQPNIVAVIEWGEAVSNLLPEQHYRLNLRLLDDGTHEIVAELAPTEEQA